MIENSLEHIKSFFSKKVQELNDEMIFLKGKKEAWEEAEGRINGVIFMNKTGKEEKK